MFNLYTLTSDLHEELAASAANEPFIREIEMRLGQKFSVHNGDFSQFSFSDNNLIYVRTGGTESIFKSLFVKDGKLIIQEPVRLLTSGQSNSLAASMEIMSFLNQNSVKGEILHGSAQDIADKLRNSHAFAEGASKVVPYCYGKVLEGMRVGVVGKPSDWLISSNVDYAKAKEALGVEIVDIPIEELVNSFKEQSPRCDYPLKPLNAPKFGKQLTQKEMDDALKIYNALNGIVVKYSLNGVTLRCFDLLTALHNTGCMALAILNARGIPATCEGDVPALLSMCISNKLLKKPGFQVNLSKIDFSNGKENLLFAHCTIPLNSVQDYVYDTHFESGIGVAVHGTVPLGKAKIFKLSSDCTRMFLEDVEIIENKYDNNLCRTQIVVAAHGLSNYFLKESLGNHHIIIW